MTKKPKPTGRGGSREGSGRKLKHGEPTRKVSVMLPESLAQWAESQEGQTISDVIIDAVKQARSSQITKTE